ncbi:AMP-binding protein [Rhizobium sp. WYCCWR 11279]|uniref:3-methylmercaptopropionyl-CoA ligase n=1 Tax=Rhizobium changzhiense TaxID=2692317 RepID=A0A7Z0RJC0_9HYPH|nr:AMP-binding protein [Rhizobium changzhiense]NNU47839.1 AMP-binding protein [Rhizobium changzhiense]NZD62554.1 AMP-binding protein [Rhizobium changzhiense]
MTEWKAPDPVRLHASLRPGALACVDLSSGRRWTYAELNDAVNRAAFVLSDIYQVARGERIAAVARNSADFIILQQAAMRLGVIFVPINWRLSMTEQEQILLDCKPSFVFGDAVSQVSIKGARTLAMADFVTAVAQAKPKAARPTISADSPAVLLYTSGTSGRPKGVMLSARNMFATAVNFGVLGEVSQESVFLCDTPMFHVIGLVTSIQAPFLQGATVLISGGFDPVATNDRLADAAFAVTHYFCVPQMADALRKAENFHPEQWASLKALFTGGAPNPPANIRWWLDRNVLMVDGYGMSEAGTLLGMPLDRAIIAEKAGSVGLPPPDMSLRILADNGLDAQAGEVGEVLVCGPNVSAGYWACPDENARAFTDDGWLKTGDLAKADADGYVTVVDRRKDLFISGGENVYPAEVEAALMEHPGVKEAAVVGIPDERWGEVGCAYIVLHDGAIASAVDLAAHCSALIARFKVPKEFVLIDALPRNGAGKILKRELRRLALGKNPEPDRIGNIPHARHASAKPEELAAQR